MAVRKQPAISDIDKECVIPARTLREVSRITDDTDENIKVSISGNMALFEVNHTQIFTRLLKANILNTGICCRGLRNQRKGGNGDA